MRTLYAAKGRDFGVALPVMVASPDLAAEVAHPLPGFERSGRAILARAAHHHPA